MFLAITSELFITKQNDLSTNVTLFIVSSQHYRIREIG